MIIPPYKILNCTKGKQLAHRKDIQRSSNIFETTNIGKGIYPPCVHSILSLQLKEGSLYYLGDYKALFNAP